MGSNCGSPARRGVGTAAQAAAEAGKIELLNIRECVRCEFIRMKEFQHLFGARVAFADLGVVGAETQQEFFVVAKERSVVQQAFVPNDDDAALGFQDAMEFVASCGLLEPVEGLARSDKIDGIGRQRGGFGGSGDAGELRIGAQGILRLRRAFRRWVPRRRRDFRIRGKVC